MKLVVNDSLDELKKMSDNTVDSVVTDPPYGLSFMGKKWDYDVPTIELWQEVFRVLKPGGHLLSFAGSRTYHRMAVNIEDAGFEIRDQIMWVYGSGFPKSLNIGKAVDKLQGNKRESKGLVDGKTSDNKDNNTFNASPRYYEETKGNSPYEGWGTALKPAHEPIVVARKPISEKNIAQNVLKWGTGGINIDASRVGTEQVESGRKGRKETSTFMASMEDKGSVATGRFPANFIHDGSDEVMGLFPDSKSTGGSGKASMKTAPNDVYGKYKEGYRSANLGGLGDSGSAARFFYCAKAGKSERNKGLEGFEDKEKYNDFGLKERMEGGVSTNDRTNNQATATQNTHPTVKPVKLMQYLVKLVTLKDGTVLDPFMGSGSTGIACKLEGFDFIGIDLDPDYVKIAEARIAAWEQDKQARLL